MLYPVIVFVAAILFIIWSTAFKKMNAFYALLLAAMGVGILSGLPADKMITALKAGFGHTMEKIGLLIILGTTLGVILEKSGATSSMAHAILKRVKEKNAPLAISITGFVVGIPLFADSAFIILSGLNKSLTRSTRQHMPVMAAALASSMYAVHCLVPPHPGITAATATAGADIGTVMLLGLLVSLPVTVVGYFWSTRVGKRMDGVEADPEEVDTQATLPPAALSFLPVSTPIVLIASKPLLLLLFGEDQLPGPAVKIISLISEPVIALSVALLVSLSLVRRSSYSELQHWLGEGVHKAGMILAIIAAGGMFGEMLQTTGTAQQLGDSLRGLSLGIFFPFLMAAILKTAQGSSTIAVITTASLLHPSMAMLGVHNSFGLALTVLSMGAGSMMISHANDAYFWVVSRFSNLPVSTTLKVYSISSLLMAITAQLLIWSLYIFLN